MLPLQIQDSYDILTREEGERVGATIAAEVMGKLSDMVDGYYFMLPFNRAHLVSMCLERMKRN